MGKSTLTVCLVTVYWHFSKACLNIRRLYTEILPSFTLSFHNNLSSTFLALNCFEVFEFEKIISQGKNKIFESRHFVFLLVCFDSTFSVSLARCRYIVELTDGVESNQTQRCNIQRAISILLGTFKSAAIDSAQPANLLNKILFLL